MCGAYATRTDVQIYLIYYDHMSHIIWNLNTNFTSYSLFVSLFIFALKSNLLALIISRCILNMITMYCTDYYIFLIISSDCCKLFEEIKGILDIWEIRSLFVFVSLLFIYFLFVLLIDFIGLHVTVTIFWMFFNISGDSRFNIGFFLFLLMYF